MQLVTNIKNILKLQNWCTSFIFAAFFFCALFFSKKASIMSRQLPRFWAGSQVSQLESYPSHRTLYKVCPCEENSKTIQYTLYNSNTKNPRKLGSIIPKSDYRERNGRDTECTKAHLMGDNGGSVAILH